ncbi:MAG: xanthine dehydrogenase family protein molybdopterin-binding subunit [Nitrospinota bacterium]|nr:MAG: xanthine dehydrogenase family protein molybdopterin-binding subunit [Nitrospinota bacterium]
MMPEYETVGKRVPRVDAWEKVTGQGLYTADFRPKDMLYGAFLLSPLPHARILHLDTSRAEKLPGVKAVLTAWNTPSWRFGPFIKDQTLFPREKVRYVGERIAAVAAVDRETAQEALDLITVEFEELPAVFDPLEALKPDAPVIHEALSTYPGVDPAVARGNLCAVTRLERGDIQEGFSQADHIFEDTFRTSMTQQCPLETHVTLAAKDHGGHVTIWSSTQNPFLVRSVIAEMLQVPLNKIRVIPPLIGGGFGSKTNYELEPYAVLLAQATGKPVLLAISREEEFYRSKPRHPCIIQMKTGVTREGILVAREVKLLFDTGATADPGPSMLAPTIVRGPYRIPHLKVESSCVYTNKIGCGSFRAPGGVASAFAFESQMDIIADALGIDPRELRLKNAVREGDLSSPGQRLDKVGFIETIERATAQANYEVRRIELARENQEKQGKNKRRGIGMACGEWRLSGGRSSGAWVKMHEDGSIGLSVGSTDLGTGAYTVLVQMVAEELGVPMEEVTLVAADTEITPYDTTSGGSRVTVSMGNAVRRAAREVREQLLELAAERLEARKDDLVIAQKQVYVKGSPDRALSFRELSQYSHTRGKGPLLGKGSFTSPLPTSLPTYCTHVAEVEVDVETGEVRVLRVVAAHDVGFAIHPTNLEGQIQGGVAQALGHALLEETRFDQGRIANASFLDYKIPSSQDVPPINALLVEVGDEKGPFGARGIGEPPIIPTAPAIANAIAHAIGVRIKELPITPEKILQALRQGGRQKEMT